MKRIGILTAGGDTPALNATIFGAVNRASQQGVEVIGLMSGFDSLFDPRMPHVVLNPLLQAIPELDATYGGSLLGSSRKYVDQNNEAALDQMVDRLKRLNIEGLICIGGDGTLNGLQPFCDRIPTVLAPKTIDNDLGLNYPNEPDKYLREPDEKGDLAERYRIVTAYEPGGDFFQLDKMVNYATPGYATAVYVAVEGVRRIRTTAESHRRIAIIEVMGRHSGFLALGNAYGQPDIILVPEFPVDTPTLVSRVQDIYRLQQNVVIVCGEGIVDAEGQVMADEQKSTDPAGNLRLSGAAEALRRILIDALGDEFFKSFGNNDSAESAIFTRKVGHTQRGGRPILFDRFYAAQLGGQAVEMLLAGQSNAISVLQWSEDSGFYLQSYPGNGFRDRWGKIHARSLHPSFYDPRRLHVSSTGINYLLPIFTKAIGTEDVEYIRESRFDSGNLLRRYHSINTDMQKRIRFL